MAIKRALIVAQSMVLNGYLSQEEYDSLFQDEISIYGKSSLENLDMLMYYQDAVIEELKVFIQYQKSYYKQEELKYILI